MDIPYKTNYRGGMKMIRKIIAQEGLERVAESLDQQMSIDISARGSIKILYDAARKLTGKPMTLAAVELLEKSIKPGDYVFITTGWADQPLSAPGGSETDGPPGTVALARAIRLTLKGLPIIITDDYLVDGIKKVVKAVGLDCVEPEELENSLSMALGFAGLPTMAVLGMPIDADECKAKAKEVVDRWNPTCCISIERGGMNKFGRIHGMGGYDFSSTQAKMDYIFLEAAKRHIATIGVGDGGNELGMANIEETIRTKIKNGNKCSCPCGAGITPDLSKVDVLLTASVSNWAGYALSCLLGLSQSNLDAMICEEIEDRVLTTCALAGFHDSIRSCIAPSVDGCGAPIHLAVIKLMREIVSMAIKRYPVKDDQKKDDQKKKEEIK